MKKKISIKIIFYLILYIIQVGWNKVIPKPTPTYHEFEKNLNLLCTHLYLSQTCTIMDQMSTRKHLIVIPNFETTC